jgi:hypothetical protein
LFITTKMLASTVQFSKNGRAQLPLLVSRFLLIRTKVLQKQPILQDPTACLGRPLGFIFHSNNRSYWLY